MTVKHKLFGKGTILDIDDGGNLIVKFLLGQKRFQPNAFDKGFLSVVQ